MPCFNPNVLITMLQTRTDLDTAVTSSEPVIIREIANTLQDTRDTLLPTTIRESMNYALWNNLWNQYGIYGTKRNQHRNSLAGNKHSRGRLLSIDFGHNIGREFSYNHIGIVIRNYTGIIVVVPVTSDRGQTFPPDVEKSVIRVKSSDYPQFRNDSLILLNQITRVDKNRIRNDLGQTIAMTPLIQEIEEKLFQLHCPYVAKVHKDEVETLNQQLQLKDRQLEEARKQIEDLSARLGILPEVAPTSDK